MLATFARLGERDRAPSLAADEAVGAVADEGSRTGRVGDLGRGLATGDFGLVLLAVPVLARVDWPGFAGSTGEAFAVEAFWAPPLAVEPMRPLVRRGFGMACLTLSAFGESVGPSVCCGLGDFTEELSLCQLEARISDMDSR